MKPREFKQLYAIPYDIKARKRLIKKLEEKQAQGPELVADVVKSSRGDGNACIIGHATVRGTADNAYTQRETEIKNSRTKTQSSKQHISKACKSSRAVTTLSCGRLSPASASSAKTSGRGC